MSNNKYIFARQLIYEAIKNSVKAGIKPRQIANECFGKYRLEITMNDVPQDMILKFYEVLAEQCWFAVYNNHEYIGD